MWYSILIAALTAYLLGNLNGAVCMSALKNDDVRSHGSGNAVPWLWILLTLQHHLGRIYAVPG